MTLNPLGSTGLLVSPLGLGLAALGRPGYINLGHGDDLKKQYDVKMMEARMHEVLDAAWLQGIRYFDAAQSYGRAEEFLASWLKQRNILPYEIVIGSKWGYTYTADWNVHATVHEVKDHSIGLLRAQWEKSKENLGSYLRLYQVHSATLESGVLDNTEVLNALSMLKAEGIFIGFSSTGPDQQQVIRKAAQIKIDGVRLFDTVQATYNLLETSAEEALKEAHELGIGVIIKEALANGRLTSRNTSPDFEMKLRFLQYKAMRMNTTVDAIALAAVLSRPWADVVLSGASTVSQLSSNINSQELAWDNELETQLHFFKEPSAIYWEDRKNMAWN